jgi:hypothetical protein
MGSPPTVVNLCSQDLLSTLVLHVPRIKKGPIHITDNCPYLAWPTLHHGLPFLIKTPLTVRHRQRPCDSRSIAVLWELPVREVTGSIIDAHRPVGGRCATNKAIGHRITDRGSMPRTNKIPPQSQIWGIRNKTGHPINRVSRSPSARLTAFCDATRPPYSAGRAVRRSWVSPRRSSGTRTARGNPPTMVGPVSPGGSAESPRNHNSRCLRWDRSGVIAFSRSPYLSLSFAFIPFPLVPGPRS